MSNKDLLKQAIAEAKTIREAAIANAKEALEESLTPHLKEMLAQKLQEMENDEMEVDETVNNVENERELINYVTEAEEDEDEEPAEEEEEEVEGDEEEVEEDEEEIDPNDPDFADKLKDLIRDIVAQETGHEDQAEMDQMDQMEEPAEDDSMVGMEDEEEIDINELLAELEEGNKMDPKMEGMKKPKMEGMKKPKMEAMKEPNPMEEELDEALATVAELRTQLQEVNLLNAKLLYVNKVFKANNLTEGQKVNVVAAFDKAETVREVKLVFETVSKNVTSRPVTTVKEHKSFASKPAGSTQKQVINEVSEQVRRMQKLAGII